MRMLSTTLLRPFEKDAVKTSTKYSVAKEMLQAAAAAGHGGDAEQGRPTSSALDGSSRTTWKRAVVG